MRRKIINNARRTTHSPKIIRMRVSNFYTSKINKRTHTFINRYTVLSPNTKLVATALSLLVITITSVAGVLMSTHQIANVAHLASVNINVYWDITCTQEVTFIDWGILSPGSDKNLLVYVKNTGESPILGSMNTSDWSPIEAENYISLSWDFGDKPLMQGRVRPTTFTISVSWNITGITTFYFTIIVIGEAT